MNPPPFASSSFRSRRYHLITTLLFVAACAVFLFLYTFQIGSLPVPYDPDPFAIHSIVSNPPPPSDYLDSVSDDLRPERVLKEAAMLDKTVILTTLNAAWASPGSVLDLFLQSFRIGDRTCRLLDHLVVVALDREAFSQCKGWISCWFYEQLDKMVARREDDGSWIMAVSCSFSNRLVAKVIWNWKVRRRGSQ